eukprot:2320392-Pleurochrysis_carterae.AAC.1
MQIGGREIVGRTDSRRKGKGGWSSGSLVVALRFGAGERRGRVSGWRRAEKRMRSCRRGVGGQARAARGAALASTARAQRGWTAEWHGTSAH